MRVRAELMRRGLDRALFDAVTRQAYAYGILAETDVRVSCVSVAKPTGCNPLISGAGEGIRTLDPNLGKVVLYP